MVIELESKKRNEFIDITSKVEEKVKGVKEGKCIVFCPHTTAALTINEVIDPDVKRDISDFLSKLVPEHGNYKHIEGNSDAHIKSSLIGCSEEILVKNGKLRLGTWQGIMFCEFDGPRRREVWVKVEDKGCKCSK